MNRAELAVDLDHLSRQTMHDHAIQIEILRMFVDQMALKMEALLSPESRVAEIAHSIKGSAKGIGAFEVAEQAAALELCNAHDAHVIGSLQNAIDRAVKDIEWLLNGNLPASL